MTVKIIKEHPLTSDSDETSYIEMWQNPDGKIGVAIRDRYCDSVLPIQLFPETMIKEAEAFFDSLITK